MRIHCDDRRLFYGDIMPDAGLAGDLNVVVLQPGALIAWHRHQHQTDYLFCVKGSVKVGMKPNIEDTVTEYVALHEHKHGTLGILSNIWHGYQNLAAGESILICYTTQHYNPDDEERQVPDENEWKRTPR